LILWHPAQNLLCISLTIVGFGCWQKQKAYLTLNNLMLRSTPPNSASCSEPRGDCEFMDEEYVKLTQPADIFPSEPCGGGACACPRAWLLDPRSYITSSLRPHPRSSSIDHLHAARGSIVADLNFPTSSITIMRLRASSH
jgi:hypothetical protein